MLISRFILPASVKDRCGQSYLSFGPYLSFRPKEVALPDKLNGGAVVFHVIARQYERIGRKHNPTATAFQDEKAFLTDSLTEGYWLLRCQ